jgi:hypothetical protein
LADILVAIEAIRDFCRVTKTRLPDVAMGSHRRVDWLQFDHMAPPPQEPSSLDIAAAETLWQQRDLTRRQKEAKTAGRIRVLRVGGSRPRPTRLGNADRSPAASRKVDPSISSGESTGVVPKEPVPRRAATSAPSRAKLEQWYIDRVAAWLPEPPFPSEAQDKTDAEQAFPDQVISRNWIRELRRRFAPGKWKEPGRRKSRRK